MTEAEKVSDPIDSRYTREPAATCQPPVKTYLEAKREFEVAYLTKLLTACKGNVSKAAEHAKRNRTKLYTMLKRHNLSAASFRVVPQEDELEGAGQ